MTGLFVIQIVVIVEYNVYTHVIVTAQRNPFVKEV